MPWFKQMSRIDSGLPCSSYGNWPDSNSTVFPSMVTFGTPYYIGWRRRIGPWVSCLKRLGVEPPLLGRLFRDESAVGVNDSSTDYAQLFSTRDEIRHQPIAVLNAQATL